MFSPEEKHGRVSGNNACTWSPSLNDWYETAKLNYGYDFTTGRRAFPHTAQPDLPIPDTWLKMDTVLAHWQALGVDGFRCDMAHMVPPEFWAWAVARARQRQPRVYFFAEAYNNDPMKVAGIDPPFADSNNVMLDLLTAGTRAFAACCMGRETRDRGLYAGPRGVTFQIWCGERNGRFGIATFYPSAGPPDCGP